MLRRFAYLGVALGLLGAGTLPVSWAAAGRAQQGRVRRVKVCVGLLPTPGEFQTSGGPPNPFPNTPDPDATARDRSPNPYPYLFWVADQRKDVKPDGWEFYNPAAPSFPTTPMIQRWGALGLTAGTQLRPDVAAYWEVVLSPANYNRLAEMDIIYLPIARATQSGSNYTLAATYFTEEQRRLLQKLVDSGVTLWVDWAVPAPTADYLLGGAETLPPTNPLTSNRNGFFTNLDFKSRTGTAASMTDPVTLRRVGHPLLDGKFVIEPEMETQIGSGYGPPAMPYPPSWDRSVAIRTSFQQSNVQLSAVVRVAGAAPATGPTEAFIAAGRYGSGYIVATAGNVGGALGLTIPSTAVKYGGQDISGIKTEDLYFLYNMVAWRDEVTAEQKNGRHTGQSGAQVQGLVERAAFPGLVPTNGINNPWQPYFPSNPAQTVNPTAPLIVNNTVIAAVRYDDNGTLRSGLHVFDANPADDIDGNGYVDDGLDGLVPISAGTAPTNPYLDLSLGQPYDRIMSLDFPAGQFPINTTVTGLTVGELRDNGTSNFSAARSHLFAATSHGILSLPAPRQGLPLTDYWVAGLIKATNPNLGITFTGAPAFTTVPGVRNAAGEVETQAQLYAGGKYQATFGNAASGKMVGFNVAADGSMLPAWYYPGNNESNRLGTISGPVTVAQIEDQSTGAIDTMVLATSISSGDATSTQQGDTTGRVDGWVVATKGDPLTFSPGNNTGTANNPAAGRRLISQRLVNFVPGQGQPPNIREQLWDPSKHYEVRVIDKATSYVVARFLPGQTGFNVLLDGQSGQIELPTPPPVLQDPAKPGTYDLVKYVYVADYSLLPQQVDQNGLTIRPRFSPATPYVRGSGSAQNQLQNTGVAGGVAVGKDGMIYYGTGQGYMCAVENRRGRANFRWKFRSLEYQDQTGLSTTFDPNNPTTHLQDYAFTTAPAAGNRIVFASRGRLGAPSTIYMMEPDAIIKFKLPTQALSGGRLNASRALDVMLEADHGLGLNPNSRFLLSTQQPWGRFSNQFSVDPDTGTVTFLNMENFSIDLSTVLTPQEALATYGVDTGGKPAAIVRWAMRTPAMGEPTTNAPGIAVVPLPVVAIYQPGQNSPADAFLSGPTIAGDRIYVMGSGGTMHELPLDPKSVNPGFPAATGNFRATFNLGNVTLYGPSAIRRIRDVATAGAGAIMACAGPAVTENLMAVNTQRGLMMLASPRITVADSNRIVDASGDSYAIATTDVTVKHRLDNSDFPIPTDPSYANTGGRPIITERRPLNRPAVVRKLDRASSLTSIFLSSAPTDGAVDYSPDPSKLEGIKETTDYADSSYLAADAGNNRCVEFNQAGKVVWELQSFNDPYNYLSPGEPLTLSGPTDVQRWIEVESRNRTVDGRQNVNLTLVYVIHTLITDAGNNRILEIVDRVNYTRGFFSATSYSSYHELVWCSQTNAQGLRLNYRTAQRVFWTDANGNRIPIPQNPPQNTPPFLPQERYLSYVMATVAGQQVSYPAIGATHVGYNRFYSGTLPLSVTDRKPEVRLGGDSVVFLRTAWKLDESSATVPVPVTLAQSPAIYGMREDRPGAATGGDRYRFTQGVVDPNVPILSVIHDELGVSNLSVTPVRRLTGITGVMRTLRRDVRFPSIGGPAATGMYFLITDRDGVWECVMQPNTVNAQYRLSWAFTRDDYTRVTGGRRFTPASARRLSNGLVLITSRTPANEVSAAGGTAAQELAGLGADVFLLRPSDYLTTRDPARGGASYDYTNLLTHGWSPDLWVGSGPRGPSIRWRAAVQSNPLQRPTPRTQLNSGGNPSEFANSYVPVQPNFADLAY